MTMLERLRNHYIGKSLCGLEVTGVFYDKNVLDAYYFTYDIDYSSEEPIKESLERLEKEVETYFRVKIWFYRIGAWMYQCNLDMRRDNGFFKMDIFIINDNGDRRKYTKDD